MYDVQNLIPIDFVLLPSYDERAAIFDHHIKRIPPNSLILVDRGYYSNDLIKVLSDKNISVIFRMKKDFVQCQKLLKTQEKFIRYDNDKQLTNCESVIKTKKKEETYIFLSNFQTSVVKIAELYNLRWKVETFFGYLKSQLEAKYLKSSNFDNCKQEVYSKIYGYLLARMIERVSLNAISNKYTTVKNRKILKKYCKNEKVVNFRSLLSNVYANISKLLRKETFTRKFKSMCKSTLKGLVDFRKKTSIRQTRALKFQNQ